MANSRGTVPVWDRYHDENKERERAAFVAEARRQREKAAALTGKQQTMTKYNVAVLAGELDEMRQRFSALATEEVLKPPPHEQQQQPVERRRRQHKLHEQQSSLDGDDDDDNDDDRRRRRRRRRRRQPEVEPEAEEEHGNFRQQTRNMLHSVTDASELLLQRTQPAEQQQQPDAEQQQQFLASLDNDNDISSSSSGQKTKVVKKKKKKKQTPPPPGDSTLPSLGRISESTTRATEDAKSVPNEEEEDSKSLVSTTTTTTTTQRAPKMKTAAQREELRRARKLLGRGSESLNADSLALLSTLLPPCKPKRQRLQPLGGTFIATRRRSSLSIEPPGPLLPASVPSSRLASLLKNAAHRASMGTATTNAEALDNPHMTMPPAALLHRLGVPSARNVQVFPSLEPKIALSSSAPSLAKTVDAVNAKRRRQTLRRHQQSKKKALFQEEEVEL